MSDYSVNRRGFLRSAAATAGGTWLRTLAPLAVGLTEAACSAKDSSAAFTILNADEAADFAAIAARIIPTTDTPGATEAGVIHFFDQAFADAMSESLEFARRELEKFNRDFGGARFAAQSEQVQDSALEGIDGEAFFELMRTMTIFGFFAMQSYGGNKDHVAWDLIGFKGHQGVWQYPFGYYDAEFHEKNNLDGDDGAG